MEVNQRCKTTKPQRRKEITEWKQSSWLSQPAELLEDLGADYIVEQGTIGIIWAYRKWASGVAECWGQLEDVTTTSGWFGFDAGIPSGITVEDDFVFVVSRYGKSEYRTVRTWFYTVSGGGIYVRDANGKLPSDGTKVSVSIYFRGTWQ